MKHESVVDSSDTAVGVVEASYGDASIVSSELEHSEEEAFRCCS